MREGWDFERTPRLGQQFQRCSATTAPTIKSKTLHQRLSLLGEGKTLKRLMQSPLRGFHVSWQRRRPKRRRGDHRDHPR
jgi:hypothetical protein